jgi:hypothetical protein
MFDSRSGNVSDDFLDLLDNDEKKAIMDLQNDWKDGMPLFKYSTPIIHTQMVI